MTVRKITLSLPDELVTAAEAAVQAGRARSVSAYIAAAAGAGEARLTLDEVMSRWTSSNEEAAADKVAEAERWALQFQERNDARASGHERDAAT